LIIKCKVCAGKGFTSSGDPFGDIWGANRKPCASCKGAGEFEINIPQEKLTTCKFCAGRGLIISAGFSLLGATASVCPTCKGLGFVQRPQIGVENIKTAKVTSTFPTRPLNIEYDLAISFAGEDKAVVHSYAEAIKDKGLKIFYADFEEVDLWGTNLYETLDSIYRLKAHYCIIFISQHYAAKVWTNHERRSAQARALMENREYILPVRLDETEIPGITPTIGYLDFEKVGHEGLVKATLEKLARYKSNKNG
jgi:hypothetical protein